MSRLSVLRQTARALLPGDCFLRRDQQLRALFVTDFPRRHADKIEDALSALASGGFTITDAKGLWLLDLSPAAQQSFIAALPAPMLKDQMPLEICALCRSLLSQGQTPAAQQPWEAVKRTLLRLDAKEADLLIPELRALCAQYKRQKTSLPTAIISLLNEEDEPC